MKTVTRRVVVRFNCEGADILAAERVVERFEWSGRIPGSADASKLLLHLARMTAIAKRYHLEKAGADA